MPYTLTEIYGELVVEFWREYGPGIITEYSRFIKEDLDVFVKCKEKNLWKVIEIE